MARRTTLSSLQEISDINLTPLMDLTFILLITFIITFPLIEQGIPVNLPTSDAEDLDPDRTRTISVDLEGALFLDDVPITESELSEQMTLLGRANPDITVLIRADEDIRYGRLVEIMGILHDARISTMGLVTRPDEKH